MDLDRGNKVGELVLQEAAEGRFGIPLEAKWNRAGGTHSKCWHLCFRCTGRRQHGLFLGGLGDTFISCLSSSRLLVFLYEFLIVHGLVNRDRRANGFSRLKA
jgi:hypothetical protein